MRKTYRNSPKGRSEIPHKEGTYELLSKKGGIVYTGTSRNLNKQVREHHYDKSKKFKFIRIEIKKIERR